MNSILKGNELLLASKSPRRMQLLQSAGIRFQLVETDFVEYLDPGFESSQAAQYLAYSKAYHAKNRLSKNKMILAADTIVVKDDEILGKPKDEQEAFEMLKKLSDSSHEVITGVSIMSSKKTVNASAYTVVKFAALSTDEIQYYLDNFKPYDKAGAYGIQDWIGHCKVIHLEGSYSNVMGLPMHLIYTILTNW